MKEKKGYRIAWWLLAAVFFTGVLVYSASQVVLNAAFSLDGLVSGSEEFWAMTDKRFALLDFSDRFSGFCSTVYVIGDAVLTRNFILKGEAMPYKQILYPYAILVLPSAAVGLLISAFARACIGNFYAAYFGICILLTVFLIVRLIANFLRCRRGKAW